MDPISVTSARQWMDLNRRQRRRLDRSVFSVALVISAAIHVLVLSLRLDAPITNRDAVITPGAANSGTFAAMRIYDVVAVEDATPSLRTAVVERPDVQLGQTVAELEALSTDDRSDLPMPESRASIAESITPRPGDPRLWAGARAEVSTVDIARARFYASIAPYRDSIAARSEARRRATDWTRTDASGGRWGVSPDTIHLGKATLSPCKRFVLILSPFTCEFRVLPGRRDEHAHRLGSFNAIQQQRASAEVSKIIDERIRAIRVRTKARRDSTRDMPR